MHCAKLHEGINWELKLLNAILFAKGAITNIKLPSYASGKDTIRQIKLMAEDREVIKINGLNYIKNERKQIKSIKKQ